MRTTRLSAIAITSALLAGALAACGAPSTPGSSAGDSSGSTGVPDKPAHPVTLNILDVAGNLQLTQGMIDEFVSKNPDVISKVNYSKAPAPDLVGKIKAQQGAGRVDIGLVLTGVDGMAAGIEQGLWEQLLPTYSDRLTNMSGYLEPAAKMQTLAGDYGVTVTYYPSGPLVEYMPGKVPTPPTTADELLAYAKANPGKFEYARPSNSGPGRTFLMGLPYILGDSDPKDPVNGWTKTWAYLAELGKYINTYPTGTTTPPFPRVPPPTRRPPCCSSSSSCSPRSSRPRRTTRGTSTPDRPCRASSSRWRPRTARRPSARTGGRSTTSSSRTTPRSCRSTPRPSSRRSTCGTARSADRRWPSDGRGLP